MTENETEVKRKASPALLPQPGQLWVVKDNNWDLIWLKDDSKRLKREVIGAGKIVLIVETKEKLQTNTTGELFVQGYEVTFLYDEEVYMTVIDEWETWYDVWKRVNDGIKAK